ncbi:hypothetical protein PILCRDRAFT_95596 [Piloderma croceum F 1598]|uniref:HAT C-terminal dimerisation domain-containing protein n=1 Tax=Piloderma croceum (strain F 1598) TaxID=765440 RepID=A0A0C3FVE8_PILCF|nr:hypothetical protein PILCRDRAFT_95596 [Piloderma croceum F 1598]
MSQSSTPLIHQVIPLFDGITCALDDYAGNIDYAPAVCMAAVRGRTMLNKYYGLTDDSVVYRIAMLLHPCYKSTYFQKAGWPCKWIRMAEDILRKEWETNYKPSMSDLVQEAVPSVTKNNDFDSFNASSTANPVDEWLSSSPVAGTDSLQWWTAMPTHPLHRMAMNFLSIPATSTDVERAFSHGRLTVSKMRHSLSDEST